MAQKIYKRQNKQTKEEIFGTWYEICDFDRRLWTDPVELEKVYEHSRYIYTFDVPIKKPLVVLPTMLGKLFSGFFGFELPGHEFYELSDFNGYYVR